MNLPEPTMPPLDTINMTPWNLPIDSDAQEMGITHHLNDPNYQPDQFKHRSVAEFKVAIMTCIPKKSYPAILTAN